MIGRSDSAFGFGDKTGLSMETPFGSDSALVRLHTDRPHPSLGSGLLSTLQFMIPPEGGEESCRGVCIAEFLGVFILDRLQHVGVLGR